jgi:hypothetical protein
MAAFWAVFTFEGSGSAITADCSLDLKQEIQIQKRRNLAFYFKGRIISFIILEKEFCFLQKWLGGYVILKR